jgi:hypothetical protein
LNIIQLIKKTNIHHSLLTGHASPIVTSCQPPIDNQHLKTNMFSPFTSSYPLLRRDNHTNENEAPANGTITASNATITHSPDKDKSGSGSGFPSFLIAIIVVGAIAAIIFGLIIFFRRRASQKRAFGDTGGLSIDGAKQGLSSFWYRIKNPRARSASAGFEGISAGRAGNRNVGRALDPDEAWDSRVGREADGYYEDTELQGTTGYVNTGSTEYVGASSRAGMPVANPFGDEHAPRKTDDNPFGDEHAAAPTLRSVSPRPFVEAGSTSAGAALEPSQTSPTRKSAFKEDAS